MCEFNRLVAVSEELVGFYATGTDTDINSVSIYEFYSRECANPDKLLMDPDLSSDLFDIKCSSQILSRSHRCP